MTQPRLNADAWHTITSALHMAAGVYAKDAKEAREQGHERIAQQFDKQSADAEELWAKLESEL